MEQMLNVKRVEELLTTRWLGREIHYEDTVDSTNLWIKELAKNGASEGCLCTAEMQTAGRGRRGRGWQMPKGEALAMSFLLYPRCEPYQAYMLSLVSGLSVARACEELGLSVQVKWPNDVVMSGKKICGILPEMQADMSGIRYVVTGIGINVNAREFPEELQISATSLYLETGKVWEREKVMACVLNHLEENYEIFMKTKDLSLLKEDYESFLVNRGRQVRIEAGDNSYIGTAVGITHTGELLVRTEDGEVREVDAGEVSVRGLYGYV